MKPTLALCALSLTLIGCAAPEKTSTEAEIRQHITGRWMVSTNSDEGSSGDQMVLAPDGSFTGVHSDGAVGRVGTWKLMGSMLVIDTSVTNYIRFADGRTIPAGTTLYYPVVFASERELVCTPGISAAGRLRFTK